LRSQSLPLICIANHPALAFGSVFFFPNFLLKPKPKKSNSFCQKQTNLFNHLQNFNLMKKKFLLLALLITLSTSLTLQGQWTNLGSGISASPRVLAGVYPVSENLIWGFTWDYNYVPVQEFLRTTDGGATWQSGNLIGVDADQFSIFLYPLDDQTAWLATADELNPIAGKIYKTSDGGENWVHQSTAFTGFNETPAGVHFWNENEGFAYGATCYDDYDDQIAIYTTADGGGQWTKVVAPNMPAQLPGEGICIWNFASFFSVVGDTVWFGTNKGRIFKSTDKGFSWVVVASPFSTSKWVSSVNFKDANTGIAIGNSPLEIKRTTDGGMTWATLTPTLSPGTIPGQAEYIPGTKSTWMIVSHNDKYMVSYNDGETWETHDSNIEAWSVEFLDSKTGFAGSYINDATTGGLYKWSGAPLGNRLFVNDDATGANNGSSWADAFNDLQSALAIAEESDQIWVAEGTYLPGSDPTATFLIDKDLRLYGGFAGTEASLAERGDPAEHPSVLSGDLEGNDVPGNFVMNRDDNSSHVVSIAESANGTMLDGFTLSGGNGKPATPPASNDLSPERGGGITSAASCSIKNCIFWDNSAVWGGAGCYSRFTDQILVENCTFEGNDAPRGALSLGFHNDAQIINCQFIENTASFGGAGFYIGNSNIVVHDCDFTNNQSAGEGGGIFLWQNTFIEFENPSMTIENCTFTGNQSHWGGGMSFNNFIPDGHLTLQGCNFDNNTTTSDGAGLSVYNENGNSSPELLMSIAMANNQFTNNVSSGNGGGVFIYTLGESVIDSCTFIGNQAVNGGGMIIQNSYSKTTNCLFQSNSANTGGGGMLIQILTGSSNNTTEIMGCAFSENTSGGNTAALEIENQGSNSSLEVNDCTFEQNVGAGQGTTTIYSNNGGSAVVELTNCLFDENSTTYGGAMQLGNTNTVGSSFEILLSNNIFTNNEAMEDGAIEFISGIQTHFKAELDNCHFEGNKSFSSGGTFGILAHDEDFEINVRNCKIINNESSSGGAVNGYMFWGGVPFLEDATVSFENTLFSGNSGDAVFSHNGIGALSLLNCTVADNPTKGVQLSNSATLTIQNTAFANPGHSEYTGSGNSTVISNGGNLVLDNSLNAVLTAQDKPETAPGFMAGTYEPSVTSPLVNAGVNAGVTATTDLAGNERIQQGTVDIGAYESPFFPTATQQVFAGELELSPNPASDFLNIQILETVSDQLEAGLFDAQGKLVSSFAYADGQAINLQGLVPGVYMVKVVDREMVYVGKFMKQ
jgi:photosystem II stability/assembly factor-like uncharacterized protein